MLILLASLLFAQPAPGEKPPSAPTVRPFPQLRELAWRADAVILGTLPEGKPGAVEVLEVLAGEAGSPGKLLTVSNIGEAGGPQEPPNIQWRWLLLYLAKNPGGDGWRILPGGWRGSTGGEQVFEPEQAKNSPPGTIAPSWDAMMERTRADLRAVASLRAVLSVAPGTRDTGVLDWLGRNASASQNRHPESVWPAAATAALDALYASPDPASRWAAARMEKRAEPATLFKRGEPFTTPEMIDFLLGVLASGSTPSADLPLALEAVTAAVNNGAKPSAETLSRLLLALPERVADKHLKRSALNGMLAVARRRDLLPPGPSRDKWLQQALSWYQVERKGADRGQYASLLVALGDPKVYQDAKGNPAGVLLLVEELSADGFRLRGILRQAGNPLPVQEKPVLRLERIDPAGAVLVSKDEPLTLPDAIDWQPGWKGPAVVPFTVNARGLDPGIWRLTVRVKNDEGLAGAKTPEGWWHSEPWLFQVKGRNPSGQPETVPVVVDPEKP